MVRRQSAPAGNAVNFGYFCVPTYKALTTNNVLGMLIWMICVATRCFYFSTTLRILLLPWQVQHRLWRSLTLCFCWCGIIVCAGSSGTGLEPQPLSRSCIRSPLYHFRPFCSHWLRHQRCESAQSALLFYHFNEQVSLSPFYIFFPFNQFDELHISLALAQPLTECPWSHITSQVHDKLLSMKSCFGRKNRLILN